MTTGPVRYRNIVWDSDRWAGFRFRPGDIVISTPPKAGTTWLQMICALLVLQRPRLGARLDDLSPWLDMQTRSVEEVFARLDAQTHRRFIKTHTPLDGLPHHQDVTYICVGRDPRDAAVSMDNHMANLDMDAFIAARAAAVGLDDLGELMPGGPPPPPPEDPAARFRAWVDNPGGPDSGSCLAGTIHHLATFWDVRDRPNIVLLHFGDLKADLAGQMRRLADRLGITVPEETWPVLVAAAGFESMRAQADELAPVSGKRIWRDNTRFFHRGVSGQWRTILDEEGARHYGARAAELGAPDLLEWVHQGASL